MYKGKKILVTVCARGNSKGVKNKNIRNLNGKSVITYTLDIIKKCNFIDKYIISTDSDEIIRVVKKYGFDIHFKRPDELASDKVSRIDAIKHAAEWAEKNFNESFELIVDMGVATPLKIADDIKNAIDILLENNASNIISVAPCTRNPYYNMVEEVNHKIRKVKSLDKKITDRRDAPKVYDMNDGVYVWEKDTLFSKNPLFNNNTMLYIMPKERSVDIDEEIDFILAEALAIKHNTNY